MKTLLLILLTLVTVALVKANDNGTTLSYANGDKYVGGVAAGVRNGQGTLTTQSGEVFSGTWVNDVLTYGTWITVNKDTFTGTFENGFAHGQGSFTFANGNVYVGNFSKGQINGKGTMTYASGSVVEGNWVDGQINGMVVFQYANGDLYKGEMQKSRKNGKGVLVTVKGQTIEGTWENNRLVESTTTENTLTNTNELVATVSAQ